MRVLHISTEDYCGAGQCCLRIHRSLLEEGVESKVLVLKNTQHVEEEYEYGFLKDKVSKIPSKILRIMGLVVTDRNKKLCLAQKHPNVPYSLPVSAVNILKNEWIEWADIIHLHWVCNYLDYPSFFKGINKPVVWTLHDEYFFYGIAHYSEQVLKNNELEIRYARLKQKVLSEVENLSIVLLSEFFYNKFKYNDLLKGRLVKVINNPVDTNAFIPIPKNVARQKLGLSNNDTIFAFTAMNITDRRKGLKVLSKVLSVLGPKFKILAIGNNPQNEVMMSNVISVGLRTSSKDISEILSAADYFAMPSYQEAFAQSPMEAMACGLPVVVFPVSGTAELINEKNGVICDDFSAEALFNGIQELMSRRYNSSEIRQNMINRFSPKSIAMKYINLYTNISSVNN